MARGIYTAAYGSMEQQRRLDVIANNMANANSPGYKKEGVHFQDMLGEITYTSQEQGPIRDTGNKLDLALFGNGYFKVQTDRGTLYTRAGNLMLNRARNLVTQDGYPVLAKSGQPVTIENTNGLQVTETGQIFDENNPVGDLDIVQFPQGVNMKKVRNGYFEPDTKDAAPVPARGCTVRQSALEGANFNPVEEMTRMVETIRNFEAYQKIMQVYNRDLDGQVIAKLSGNS